MLNFLGSFSSSFILALFIWPFLAALLTLPLLVFQYRRHNRIVWLRVFGTYCFVLYALGLVSFTLYPMPDNPTIFCQDNGRSPLLNPLHVFTDLRTEGLQAVLQIIMNFLFFVPLGFFARHLFKLNLKAAIVIGFSTSLFIELAQLTGMFGVYPCSYRYFDVNDLVINTLGAVAGYIFARLIPLRYIEKVGRGVVIRKAGLLRHFVAFTIDQGVTFFIALIIILGIYLAFDRDLTAQILTSNIVFSVVTAVIFGVMPYVLRGWSIGGYLVRLNHDDIQRSGMRRVWFYTARALLVGLLFYATWGILPYLVVISIAIIWWQWKRLPYQFI